MRTWLGSTIVAASLFLAAMMALGQGARGLRRARLRRRPIERPGQRMASPT